MSVAVQNVTDGHSVPTGFSVRPLYIRVSVKDQDGNSIYESGDLDPNGQFRDIQSRYVQEGMLPLDRDLFNLQPKFIVRNQYGGEREEVVPVNFSPSMLPFLRPYTMSWTLTGRPLGVRIHRHGIQVGDERATRYTFDLSQLDPEETYTIDVSLVAPMIPTSLIGTIAEMGFEYGMTAKQLADRVVSGHMPIWHYQTTLSADDAPESAQWSLVDPPPFRYEDLK
jgi:hypothetical protein